MKIIKKIVVSIVVMLLALAIGTSVFAATTPVTFGLSEYRRETNGKQYGYRINNGNKKVWKVIVYDNDGTTMNFDNTIYCLKAERGFYTATPNSFKQTYDNMQDFAEKSKLVPSIFENDNNYYSANWILDHAYIPYYAKAGDSVEVQAKKTEQAKQDRENLLNATGMSESLKKELTDDDIDVVQQMALWYFTNTKAEENADIYHPDDFGGAPSFQALAIADKSVGTYTTVEDFNRSRHDAMEDLYQYMVSTARSEETIEYYKTHNGKVEEPITIAQEVNPSAVLDGGNYIVGPYKINKNNDLPFEFNAKFTDQDGNDLSGKYTLLNANKEPASEGTTIKDLIGQSFYISIPSSNIDDITKIKFSYTGSYMVTSKGYWTTTQNPDTVQPLVAVEKKEVQISGEKEVGVAKREFDLSLRKFISEVNGKGINREPTVDTANLNKLVDGVKTTTAVYNHDKRAVAVKPGDVVTYTIRVYNEGEIDGYVGEITDYLPPELEFINDLENYPAETDFNAGYGWRIDPSNNRVIKTDKLAYSQEQAERDQNASNLIKAYNGTTLDYKEVKVKCKVKNSTGALKKITNLAQITQATDSQGRAVTDRDSTPNGNFTLPADTDLPIYKDDELNKYYIPGQEDDDDFEKVIIQEFDLALRKFISGKNGTTLIGREPVVDVTNLANGTATTATYNHPKKPVDMARGDIVEYTIRVYNEGSIDGYVNEIVDKLPEELEFLPDNETNIEYEWQVSEDGRTVKTEYLKLEHSMEIESLERQTTDSKLLKAFDGTTLSYKDVKIVCRVKDTAEFGKKLTNLAEITDASDSWGMDVVDRDSEPNNMQVPSDEELPNYKDDEINNEYVPGQEDDDDFEKVRIVYFDLALRKFITAVDDQEVTTRVPQLSLDENGNIKYDHTKDPVEVENGNIVTYTIRIYNEGLIDGYATEIKDDIPEGLKFLPDNPINREYRWQETEDGKSVVTDYLSKAQEETDEANLIQAYDPEKGLTENNPDYRDVKIAFQVTEPNTSDRILVNTAEISDDSDSSGDPIDDIDSTPDNNNEWNQEDDLDKEFVKVKYFDLALKKWVSKAIIIDEDGKQTVQETGHTGDEDPEPPAKVDLGRRDINKVTVKFEFQIKITNEGEIAGYAKEITDYIPEGLRFVQEDNPDWYTREPLNGKERVATKLLENTLLQPGESATVSIILTWINGQDNMGLKTNIAEISQDYNDSNTPDIDSVPDNFKEDEDDIDDAPVMLTVALGDAKLYIGIVALVVITLGGGIFIIKKYVI